MGADKASGDLGSEPTHWYFHNILMANASQKANPDSVDEEKDPTSWWKELQNHIMKGL